MSSNTNFYFAIPVARRLYHIFIPRGYDKIQYNNKHMNHNLWDAKLISRNYNIWDKIMTSTGNVTNFFFINALVTSSDVEFQFFQLCYSISFWGGFCKWAFIWGFVLEPQKTPDCDQVSRSRMLAQWIDRLKDDGTILALIPLFKYF